MAFDNSQKKLPLVATDGIVAPKDRVFERTQGCWNCKNMERATKWWSEHRQQNLMVALGIANASPDGENDPKVMDIKHMVNTTDHAVASGNLVRCTSSKATNANGQSIRDLVAFNYLCSQWSAAQGASIARGGQKADDLPEELADKVDAGGPQSLDDLLRKTEIN